MQLMPQSLWPPHTHVPLLARCAQSTHTLTNNRVLNQRFSVANTHACWVQIVATGRRPHFYVYDMEAGEVTRIPRMAGISEKSLELFETSPCGRYIAFGGKSGKIYIVSSTSLLPSPNHQYPPSDTPRSLEPCSTWLAERTQASINLSQCNFSSAVPLRMSHDQLPP